MGGTVSEQCTDENQLVLESEWGVPLFPPGNKVGESEADKPPITFHAGRYFF